MTATNRSYPDISFVETDTEAIVNALIQSYEKFTGRTLYPADPVSYTHLTLPTTERV